MICNNCGAEYNDHLLTCPYCGFENLELANRNYENTKNKLFNEKEKLKRLPSFISKKTLTILIHLFFCFIILLIVAMIVIAFFSKIQNEHVKTNEVKMVQHFEELLTNYEYEQLAIEVERVSYTYLTYDKYVEIVNIYKDYERLVNYVDMYYEYNNKVNEICNKDMRISMMQRLCELSLDSEEILNDNIRLANEEHIINIRQMGIDLFLSVFPVSDDLLEAIMNVEDDDFVEEFEKLDVELCSQMNN